MESGGGRAERLGGQYGTVLGGEGGGGDQKTMIPNTEEVLSLSAKGSVLLSTPMSELVSSVHPFFYHSGCQVPV